jgi:hypothetical protein
MRNWVQIGATVWTCVENRQTNIPFLYTDIRTVARCSGQLHDVSTAATEKFGPATLELLAYKRLCSLTLSLITQ